MGHHQNVKGLNLLKVGKKSNCSQYEDECVNLQHLYCLISIWLLFLNCIVIFQNI